MSQASRINRYPASNRSFTSYNSDRMVFLRAFTWTASEDTHPTYNLLEEKDLFRLFTATEHPSSTGSLLVWGSGGVWAVF